MQPEHQRFVVTIDGPSRITSYNVCYTKLLRKVPRYVAFVDALPQTPTHRVAKYRLRQDPTLRARFGGHLAVGAIVLFVQALLGALTVWELLAQWTVSYNFV